MKKLLTKVLKLVIDKVKRNKFVQNVFESPFELEKFQNLGVFRDSDGNVHKLYKGLRTKIKPGWERMVNRKQRNLSDVDIDKLKVNSYLALNKLESTLNTYGKTIENSRVLEIGCDSGSVSFAMAERGAKMVVGTEFNGYKVDAVSNQTANNVSKLNEADEFLKSLRNKLQGLYSINNNIEFKNDDICNTSLNVGKFDVICSWDVLEHVHDPKQAFESISKLLDIGGISIHKYNSFFSLNGGHSMCTLDFLWGHARLSKNDFVNYVNTLRPSEVDKALSFYEKGLNRLTLTELNSILINTGMEILGVIPFTKEQHLRMVNEDTLSQVRKNYKSIQLMDLISPTVMVITKRIK